MALRAWVFTAVGLVLSGCVSTGNREARVSAFAAYGVPEPILVKIARVRPLELEEIVAVSSQGVPASLLIEFLSQTRAVYELASADVSLLQDQGVASDTVDYLLSTPAAALQRERLSRPPPSLYFGPYIGPYGGPLFIDPACGIPFYW